MRDYAKIAPQFWIGETGRKLRGNPEAQIVGFYLISNPHSNMIGMYYLPVMFIAHETGLTVEGASKGLARCIEAEFCGYDQTAEVVWVYEMARFQIDAYLNPGDKRCAGVQNTYNDLPQNRFLPEFFDKYEDPFHLKEKRLSSEKTEAPSKPLRSQEQEQELEQKQEQELLPAGKPTGQQKSTQSETELQGACRKTWAAYSTAYAARYGPEPVRNAKVNALVKQVVQRLGADESPHVAAFFVSHANAYYIRKSHDLGSLVADAEKLRMEWASGRMVTTTSAQQADRTQSNFNSANEAIRILEGARA